jgi:hypothetical protein
LGSLRRLDEGFRGVAVAIPFKEELGADHTLSIQDEGPWIRDALRPAFGCLVADVVSLDRLAPGVGEQREGDLRAVGEGLQDLRVVIADADDLNPGSLDRLEVALQLDQLRAAERSPVGGAVKDQGDLTLVEELVE